MEKYYRKLILLFLFSVGTALLIFLINGNWFFGRAMPSDSRTVLAPNSARETSVQAETESVSADWTKAGSRNALILYSPNDETSVYYEKNLRVALKHLRIGSQSVALSRTDSVSYPEYDLVIIASPHVETEMADPITRLFDYAEEGGRVFWGMLPSETGAQFQSVYRKLGIIDLIGYTDYSSYYFEDELLPGLKGLTLSDEGFLDAGLNVTLEDQARIYAAAGNGQTEVPLIWSFDTGKGRCVFYNGTAITGDFYRGISAGCVSALFDDTMYPVINALCLFIDDFPSPQYENESEITRKEYNRTVKEFYRDIWWPDMQSAANRYGDVYTGLFIATYNDIVNPEDFVFDEPSMERYYGNSLLRSGHELGAHGYNHQSLTLAGGTPASMNYNPWASQADMTASLKKLASIASDFFPGVVMTSYVPPSNYLSAEGRSAVKEALPGLKVISGIYTGEGEEGDVYVQDFEIAKDGIAEFPRISSGMFPSDYEKLSYLSALGLYGVFSHFIHPDDLFDEERGRGQTWDVLFDSYSEMIGEIHASYPFLRSLSVSEAADALFVCQEATPSLDYQEDAIYGSVEHFYGEVFFYLKTDKNPVSVDKSCSIQPIDPENGSLYYLVTVNEPVFTIKLEKP